MGVTVTVRDGVRPGTSDHEFVLEQIPPALTLRDLIRTRVREEVAKANAGAGEVRRLVQPLDAKVTPNGYPPPPDRMIDWKEQAKKAEEGFRRNRFFVVVNGRQVEDLDEELELTAHSEVRFIRLVPLVGG